MNSTCHDAVDGQYHSPWSPAALHGFLCGPHVAGEAAVNEGQGWGKNHGGPL